MPELVNSRVGSLPGTSGADGTMVWPLPLKNSRKSLRMRAVVYGVVGVIWLRLADGSGPGRAWRARTDGKSTGKGYQSAASGRRNAGPSPVRQAPARPASAGLASVVRIPAGGGADGLAVESAAGQQVGRLASLGQVGRAGGPEAAPDQVAGQLGPVALEAVHGGGDHLAGQAMGAQFGADVQRPVAGIGAAADQEFGEPGIVLPALPGQALHRGRGLLGVHSAGGQLAGQLPARVLAPHQQAQGALHRGLRGARLAAGGGVFGHRSWQWMAPGRGSGAVGRSRGWPARGSELRRAAGRLGCGQRQRGGGRPQQAPQQLRLLQGPSSRSQGLAPGYGGASLASGSSARASAVGLRSSWLSAATATKRPSR